MARLKSIVSGVVQYSLFICNLKDIPVRFSYGFVGEAKDNRVCRTPPNVNPVCCHYVPVIHSYVIIVEMDNFKIRSLLANYLPCN